MLVMWWKTIWQNVLVLSSLGCKAIFLLGGKSREDMPIAMFLRSGDVVLMAGEARECFHGQFLLYYIFVFYFRYIFLQNDIILLLLWSFRWCSEARLLMSSSCTSKQRFTWFILTLVITIISLSYGDYNYIIGKYILCRGKKVYRFKAWITT